MITDLPDLLAKRAELSPGRVALETADGSRRLTYGELDARASAAAAMLAARGVGRGMRVAWLARHRIEFFELLFGCARLGAVLVPLNWRMPAAELAPLIAHADPALVIHGRAEAAIVAALDGAVPRLEMEGDYERALAQAPAVPPRPLWGAGESWYFLYTSGTTGRPKAVIYTYRMALANYVSLRAAIDLVSTDSVLCFLPLFHTAGINLHALPALFAGGRVIVADGFDPEVIVSLIEAERLDLFFAVPTVYHALLDHPRFAAAPLARVRHWGSGGAPLCDTLAARYRDFGLRLCNGMGMTETGPTAFLLDPADAWTKMGSIGKPQLLCSVRLVDEGGADAAPGEVGHLLFAGPGITPGYWRDEEATRAAFTADGWLRSGDLVRRDADGFYHVVGRAKEMFISGGENVYPVEVENVLCAHPAVVDAAVVGRPDPRWGEVGVAFVQAAPGASPDAEALMDFCRSRLAGYKVPRRLVFVEDFPRTSAGKIQKHRLEPAPVMAAFAAVD